MKNSQKNLEPTGEQGDLFLAVGSRNLVKDFPLPESDLEQQMTVTSGRNISGQLTSVSPIGLLAKMLLESSAWKINPAYTGMYSLKWKIVKLPAFTKLTTMRQYTHDKAKCLSTVFVKVLKKEGMKSKRLLYRLQVSKRPTKGNGYGLLPTVLAVDGSAGGTVKNLTEFRIHRPSGQTFSAKLKDAAASGLLPTVQTQGLKQCENGKTKFANLKLLPTPTAMIPAETNMDKLENRRNKAKLSRKNGKRMDHSGNEWTGQLHDMAKSGLLPTPQAQEPNNNTENLTNHGNYFRRSNGTKLNSSINLLAKAGLLPTPTETLGEAKTGELMPTPTAQDGKNSTFPVSQRNRDTVIGSIMQETEEDLSTSQLNPLFVAEMMAFPIDWLVLPFLNGETKA